MPPRPHLIGACLLLSACAAFAAPPRLFPEHDFDGGIGRVNDLAFSSDGRLLAAAGARGVGVWDAQTGRLIRNETVAAAALRVTFGGQDTRIAFGTDDGRVTVVDLRSGVAREIARHPRAVTSVAFAADGRLGASGDLDGGLLLWDPDRGLIAPLKDGGHKKEVIVLSFGANGTLLSVSRDLRVVSWEVGGKRPIRRGMLQSEVAGRTIVPTTAALDPIGDKLVVGSQLVTEPRGGMLTDRGGPARPGDLRRDNVLLPYLVGTGNSGDPIATAEFTPEHVAVSPSACFTLFTSFHREQARLHVWGLIERGDDLLRSDLPARATAIALDNGGRVAAIAVEPGRILGWQVSGATQADCDAYAKKPTVTAPAEARITLGPETEPLLGDGASQRMAVLRFETTGVEATLGDGVAEMVAGQLANRPGLVVIERTAVDSVLRELEIQRSGLTATDAVRIGRGLNARKVLFGSVRRFGDDTFIVIARIVDVETQQVQGSREVSCEHCKVQDLPKAVEALRRIIAQ